jgi:hypothetical protein
MTAYWSNDLNYGPALLANYVAWADLENNLHAATYDTNGLHADTVRIGGSATVETAAARPSITVSAGGIYLAWAGTDGNHSLNIAEAPIPQSGGPIEFTSKITLSGSSVPMGASLVDASTTTSQSWYLAYLTESGRINIARFDSPPIKGEWDALIALDESAIDTPALAWDYIGDEDPGRLWMAWAGTDGLNTLNVARGVQNGPGQYDKAILDGRPLPSWLPGTFQGPARSKVGPQLDIWRATDLFLLGFNLAYATDDGTIYALMSQGNNDIQRWKFADQSGNSIATSRELFAWSGLDQYHTLNINNFDAMSHSNADAGSG